ncbi:Cupin domain protein [Chitinophaga sp. CF118]|uniref:cupin domain-containing protein n=1 Tax=Chitinophaga sp. CF118 TaxID=1884367 RepID=UPI0008E98B90|nr:cupin domain-containing protein [Chitinophaga sp. CF118]SFD82416.1 Cupin domain protein [Chitinophaga sp. CF118]
MNRLIGAIFLLMTTALYSCNNLEGERGENSKVIFPKGDRLISKYFTGTAYLQMLVESDTIYDTQIGNVTFQPGARSNWHSHPGGQILLITSGKGYYQEKDKPKRIIRKGDVITCSPNTVHWHGASSDSGVSHIAIGPNTEKGSVVWLVPVTDAEYNNGPH